MDWLEAHWPWIAGAGIVAVVGYWGYRSWTAEKEREDQYTRRDYEQEPADEGPGVIYVPGVRLVG